MKAFLLALALAAQTVDQGEAVFGPTNLDGIAGNGRLTAGFSARGEMTLLRWPNPSFEEHSAYLTALDGGAYLKPRMGAQPNMGVLLGLSFATSAPGFTWVRDDPWTTRLAYAGETSAVLVAVSRRDDLGLTVTTRAAVPPDEDLLGMDVEVDRDATSPVASASLVLYENLGPTLERADPTRLYAIGLEDYALLYLADRDALLHYALEGGDLSEFDATPGWTGVERVPSGPGVFFAWGGAASSGHQAGIDSATPCPPVRARPWPLPLPADPFLDPAHLTGTTRALCQAAGALSWDLSFDALGHARVPIALAAASEAPAALALLDRARREGFDALAETTDRSWAKTLAGATLPPGLPPDERAFVERALISIRQGSDPGGAIVASVSRQPAYFADWPRDGTFIDLFLDLAGFSDGVGAHKGFYVRAQRTEEGALRPRLSFGPAPAGSWAMNYFTDGVPFGPVNFEIDQTGLPLWGFWAHAQLLPRPRRREYLLAVWPAVARAAEALVACRDAATGLPCPAAEDDSLNLTQGLQGASAVLMGLKSASAIGRTLCADEGTLGRWDRRASELEGAILDRLYLPEEGHFAGGAARGGTWIVYPLRLLPPTDPRMASQADYLWSRVSAALGKRVTDFSYEGEPLLALARLWGSDPARAADLREAARVLTTEVPLTGTRQQGESVTVVDGAFVNRVGIPHLYEASLGSLDLYALQAPERFAATEDFSSARCEGCSCSTVASGSPPSGAPVLLVLGWLRRRRHRRRR